MRKKWNYPWAIVAGLATVSLGVASFVPTAVAANEGEPVVVDGVTLEGGGKDYGFTKIFNDVDSTLLHAGAISWMYDLGVSTGWSTPNGYEYRPFEPVSREAMAAFIYRFAGSPDFSGAGCFNDVEGLLFEKQICWMKSKGLTTGFPDGGYHPFESVNRDAMAAFLHRLSADESFSYSESPDPLFTDVNASMEHADHMAWMKATGISTGWPDGTFKPLQPVNRDAMAAFLYRFAKTYPTIFKADEAALDPEAKAQVQEKCELRNEPLVARANHGNDDTYWAGLKGSIVAQNALLCTDLVVNDKTAQAISVLFPEIEGLFLLTPVTNTDEDGSSFNPKLPKAKILQIDNVLGKNDLSKQVRRLADFSGMPNLEGISGAPLPLQSVPNFSHLPKLRILNLYAESHLDTIPKFDKLPRLQSLAIHASSSNVAPIPDFELPELTHLLLTGSYSVVPNFQHLPNLEVLSLVETNGHLTEVPNFDRLPALRLLDLRRNTGLKQCPDMPYFNGEIHCP